MRFGVPGSSPNGFISVSSASGISSVRIAGDPAGFSFAMDDITFQPVTGATVPESDTAVLFLSGTAMLLAGRRRRAP